MYVCVCVCVYVWMYVCMYECLYVCVYVCVQIRIVIIRSHHIGENLYSVSLLLCSFIELFSLSHQQKKYIGIFFVDPEIMINKSNIFFKKKNTILKKKRLVGFEPTLYPLRLHSQSSNMV